MRVIILQDTTYLVADYVTKVTKTKVINFNGNHARFEIFTTSSSFSVSLEIPFNSTEEEAENIYQMVEETRVNLKNFLISTDPLEVEYTIPL